MCINSHKERRSIGRWIDSLRFPGSPEPEIIEPPSPPTPEPEEVGGWMDFQDLWVGWLLEMLVEMCKMWGGWLQKDNRGGEKTALLLLLLMMMMMRRRRRRIRSKSRIYTPQKHGTQPWRFAKIQ